MGVAESPKEGMRTFELLSRSVIENSMILIFGKLDGKQIVFDCFATIGAVAIFNAVAALSGARVVIEEVVRIK